MKNLLTKVAFGISTLVLFGAILMFMSFKNSTNSQVYTYMQITTIESIIPGGLGRSKMFETNENGECKEIATMENFYSMVGINFGNISSNEKQIVSKINQLTEQGWELYNVSVGVQSPADSKGGGIYMTRHLFRKAK